MNHNKIYFGGIYQVNWGGGVQVQAEVLRALPPEEVRLRLFGTDGPNNVVYECRLIHTVGQFKKGYVFQARSRAVMKMIEPPPPDAGKRRFATPGDLRRAGVNLPDLPTSATATPSSSPSHSDRRVTDYETPLPPAAPTRSFYDLAKPAPPVSCAKSGLVMTATMQLTVALRDLPDLIDMLAEYQPVLLAVAPPHSHGAD